VRAVGEATTTAILQAADFGVIHAQNDAPNRRDVRLTPLLTPLVGRPCVPICVAAGHTVGDDAPDWSGQEGQWRIARVRCEQNGPVICRPPSH
jgi:hypothetical protein